jgi:hypothetical protein
LPQRRFFYEFASVLDGVTFTERYASGETDLTIEGNVYAQSPLEHGDIKQSISLDRDEVELKGNVALGQALTKLVSLKLEAKLFVKIMQGDVAAGLVSNVEVIFTGEVVPGTLKGSRITAKCLPGGSAFDRKLPPFIVGRTCNYAVYSPAPACGQLKALWRFNATISDPGVAGFPFEFVLSGLARDVGIAPTYFENWFAGGWIEFGSGATWQRRAILLSTLPVAGVMTITLNRDPEPYPEVGDDVALFPGCDGTKESCRAYDANSNPLGKFDNYDNFGGHPFVPVGNPTVVKSSPAGGGSKK